MNPFKHKQIKEFTVADCELYISKYPYGEHIIEVNNISEILRKHNKTSQRKVQKTETKKIGTQKNEGKKDSETNTSNDIVKTIFAWIGIIVVVLIVGTIIIMILNEILPYNWWNKYRYIIYPAGLALGRWLQKEFNW